MFTNLVEDFNSTRYTTIANGVLHMRIAPSSAEASVLALFTGMSNLGFGVVGAYMGNLWTYILGIS